MENCYVVEYFAAFTKALMGIDFKKIEALKMLLIDVKREGGRVFCIGVGGGAAEASHVAQDLRKIAGIEAYCPTDSVSEITARTNDDGWEMVFEDWLVTSKLSKKDMLLIFSTSGGTDSLSNNIKRAIVLASHRYAGIAGIVSDTNGALSRWADVAIIIDYQDFKFRTPFTESLWSVIMHCVVNDPMVR